ncbi:MAG: hypothetical protein PHC88_06810 [Terrimicrobiaceae bacterium]|nr:hypothetical protein [Terrimicrobiaceae bacterium]
MANPAGSPAGVRVTNGGDPAIATRSGDVALPAAGCDHAWDAKSERNRQAHVRFIDRGSSSDLPRKKSAKHGRSLTPPRRCA